MQDLGNTLIVENGKKILIINYGMGNIGSIQNAFLFLGIKTHVSSSIDDIKNADAYILPGVGAFGAAMNNLNDLNITGALTNQVLKKKKPILGICLGLQLMGLGSEEDSSVKGLGWLRADVKRIQMKKLRVPHVGWNNLIFQPGSKLLANVDENANFYFDHSYHMICDEDLVAAYCNYDLPLVAAIKKGNIWATQFHPEKSQRNGLKILRNFINS